MLKHLGRSRRIYYILFALGFGFVWYLFKLGGMPKPLWALASAAIDISFSLVALVITVELLLPALFYKRRYWLFSVCFFGIIAAAGSLTIISQMALHGYSLGSYKENLSHYREHYYYWFWSDLVFGSYFLIAFIALSGLAIRLSFDRIVTARHMETLEKERSIAELEMLKNQINPHFLFNALNTIYYKIDKVNTPARVMVEQFSSLLRYQLYECNVAEVEIEKELKFISDYIELQKERLSQHVSVGCNPLKSINGFFIAPFILMPLIENCFKHVSQYKDRDNMIAIHFELKDGWFCCETVNTIQRSSDGPKPGIGLANVKKRLDLIYPGRHILTNEINNEFYSMTLKIKI